MILKHNCPEGWQDFFEKIYKEDFFEILEEKVTQEYQTNVCFPPINQIFRAFELCSLQDLKVVIIGQDPYHGLGQANGLCFSVNPGVKFPPSLANIIKELQSDVAFQTPLTGDLTPWASQGVLLLNATLTVRQKQAGSHQKLGWEIFTDSVIQYISEQKNEVIFLLWGAFAHKKGANIDTSKHHVLKCGHPSFALSHKQWFGNKHFSKTNDILRSMNKEPIDWQLV
jgi:uracil-DNA glycosylase